MLGFYSALDWSTLQGCASKCYGLVSVIGSSVLWTCKTAFRLHVGRFWEKLLRKTFAKTFNTVFIVLQRLHWFVLYARNGWKWIWDTDSLVILRRGLMHNEVKIMCRIRILPVRIVFAVYTRKTKGAMWYRFRSTRFCYRIQKLPFSLHVFAGLV